MTAKTISSGMTYGSGFTITSADGNGFALTNNGVIGATGLGFGLVVQTSGDFVYNAGKILASTATGDGIFSAQTIRITNRSGGLINAAYGIQLGGGGTINNASGGSITGLVPIEATTASVYVGNGGAIVGTGTSNTQGGIVLSAGGYVYNKPNASISGANGVLEGVLAKVRNEGTIVGNNAVGVMLNAGGTVTSETQTPNSAATISGSYGGISITGGVGYVLDGSGQISGGVAGVFLQAGGYIHQIGGPGGGPGGGTITANYAVAINNGPGTVETGGRIIGTKLGVGMDGAGPHKVKLSSFGATISGANAISISGGSGYIYNSGTINGTINSSTVGTAVILPAGYNNLLEIYGGAKVYGQVNGGNFQDGPHTTTLLLGPGGLGTLTGFGSRYYNIGNVTVKSGASWTMDNTNTFDDPSFVSAGSTTFLPITLLDAGTLTFAGSEFGRLTLGSNAHLTVSKSGVMTPAYLSVAVYAATGTTAPVVATDGQITAAGNDGIRLDDGGTVTNQADGTISAQFVGVRIQNAKGTVTNSGLIKSTITYGVALGAGGSVTNTGGTIMGTLGVGIYGGAGTVTNTGRIAGSGSNDGVLLKAGGTVINQAGTIIGLGGIFIFGGAGTVTNYGQITGTEIYSVNLSPGFANRLRIGPGASFSGSFVDGGNTAGAASASTIELLSAAGAGTINGIGSQYRYFSNITVDAGATWTIASGSIAGYQTVVDSGTLINDVVVDSGITLANGTLINASGYLFNVAVGVSGLSGTNVVVNDRDIQATQIGVSFATAGRVTNQSDGFIGGRIGVYIEGSPASVVNQGLIEGYTAVYLPNGGSVDNQSGLISGRVGVVIVAGNGTVRNAGTIVSVGDYGVILPDDGADRLVIVPGSTIAGLVHGGLAGTSTSFSTLELASGSGAGTIGGIGSKYMNFAAIAIDAGAAWTFAAGQTIAANRELVDNGTLTNNASVSIGIQLGSGAALTNASGGTVSASGPVIAPAGLASAATVVNYGLLDGSAGDYGVALLNGGSVTNRAGTIRSRTGVVIDGAGTVTNTGSIVGSSGAAVSLVAGFRNQVAMSPGAVFTGKVDGGNVSASGTAISTLELMTGASAGTLAGLGSQYVHFQNFQVDPGASWTIAAGQQLPATYTLTDNGTLTNNASVLTGVTLGAGAYLDNATGVTISSASDGALALGAGATVVNRGVLQAGSFGVSLIGPNAEVINHYGTISGSVAGVAISGGTGTVANYNEVLGGGVGVSLLAGGTVDNWNGEIVGFVFGGVGISGGAGTVVNYGTIIGGNGTAVALGAGFQNRVIVGPGAVFDGVVNGGNTLGAPQASTIELARIYQVGLGNFTGTVSGLGGQYVNFAQILVDAGASWAVTGSPTLAVGITLSNSGALAISHGALSVAGSVYNNGLIQVNAGTMTAGRLLGTGEVVIGAGGTLMASGLVGNGQTIDFAGSGLLALSPALFSGQIDGLRAGGTIELTGITDATAAGIVNGNTLAISQSAGPPIDLTLDPTQSYAGAVFPVATLDGVQFVIASGQTGPTIIDQGETVSVAGAAGSTMAAVAGGMGGIVVTGVGSELNITSGLFSVGGPSLGSLAIEADGTVTAQGGAVIANTTSASGSSISVSGTGSSLQVTGTLIDGNAGAGLLDIGPGASVSADVLELGLAAGGVGVLTMEGSLTTTGSLVVGGAGAGELSLLSGASVTIDGDLDIGGGSGSSGNVDVENTTGTLIIDGNLNVGVGGGVATMTIGLDTGVQLDNGGINQGKFSKVIAHTAFDPIFENSNGGGFVLATGTNTFLSYFNNNDSGQVTQDAAGDQSVLQVPTIYASAGSGSFQINSGDSALTLNADGVSGQTFQFTDNTGTLVIGIDQLKTIDTPSSGTGPFTAEANPNLGLHLIGGFGGTIASMVVGDAIVVDTTAQAHISYAGSGTVVAVIDNAAGTQVGTLAFASAALAAEMSIGSATASQLELVACFAAGTRIETAAGLVAVEDLRVGDEIRTVSERPGGNGEAAGSCEPIVWIGSRTVNCARHPNPETVWPVRVRAGAFGENVPERETWLSPDHAVFVNGVLIPVKLLINGESITQVKRRRVTYYHVELPEHAVILAEGLTVESYLDIGDRANFGDSESIRLHPDFAARLAPDAAKMWETRGAVPLVVTGEALNAARSEVASAAAARQAMMIGGGFDPSPPDRRRAGPSRGLIAS
jgi:fibronectin-binding autotransporter adhesin